MALVIGLLDNGYVCWRRRGFYCRLGTVDFAVGSFGGCGGGRTISLGVST